MDLIRAILKSVTLGEKGCKLALEVPQLDETELLALYAQKGKAVGVSAASPPVQPLPLERAIEAAEEAKPEPEAKPVRKGGKARLKPIIEDVPPEPPAQDDGSLDDDWPEGDDSPGLADGGEEPQDDMPPDDYDGSGGDEDPDTILDRAMQGLTGG